MQSRLRLLVHQFAQNAQFAGKAMREMLESDSVTFTQQAFELLKRVPVGPGTNYVRALLFISKLCDPDSFSLAEATEAAKRLQKLDPNLDVHIVKRITSPASKSDQLEAATAERFLELISAFSDLSRILPDLAELLKHPSPRIRSKAVLLIGRASANAKLTESHLNETDDRIRANAIEALWGNQSDDARAFLAAAATDTNNRVAANAAMGFYKLDDTYSIALILDMAENQSPPRRVSALWAMSETRDPRFLGTLAKFIGDANPGVRNLAFNAVAKIRKNKTLLLNGPKLKLFVTEVECTIEAQRRVRISVCLEDGKPAARITGTQFALEENKRLVAKYSVEELAQTDVLAVGIAIPRILDQTNEFLLSCESFLKSNLQQKRSQDQWGILKYAGDAKTVEAQPGNDASASTPLKFSSDLEALAQAVDGAGDKDAVALSLTDAAQRIFAEITPQEAQRHVLLIDAAAAGSSSMTQPEADQLLTLAKAGKIQVYSLVVAGLDSDVNPHLRRLCDASGGRIVIAGAIDEIPRALEVLFCTLPSSYEITYLSNAATPPSRLSLQVYSPQGCGGQACELQATVAKESPISHPALHESPAHSLEPALALGS
jgi:HEAT repeat protein